MDKPPPGRRPEWISKSVLQIVVAVLTSIAVTAFTPLGDALREVFFPTKADVYGTATLSGQPLPGAGVLLNGKHVDNTRRNGKFVIHDVDNGTHDIGFRAVNVAIEEPTEFTIERRETEHALEPIDLAPRAQLAAEGIFPKVSSAGFTYDVVLWIAAEPRFLERIRSVSYALPTPFASTAVTVKGNPERGFCLHVVQTFSQPSVERPVPRAAVTLRGGRSFDVSYRPGPQPPVPACPARGKPPAQDGSTGPPRPAPPPPPSPHPPPPGPPPPPPSNASETIQVPAVEGLTYENAKAVLEALRFEVERRNVSDPAKPGTVVGQDPPARTRLARGARVTVSVSTGAEKAEVPNVEGMERANARATLEERGFVVREGKEQTADPSLDGVVTKQSPEAGDNAATGSTVTITIGAFTPNP